MPLQRTAGMRKKRSFSDRAAVGQTLTLSGHPAAKLGSRSCIDGAAEVGVHKTSTLQDLERGRPNRERCAVTTDDYAMGPEPARKPAGGRRPKLRHHGDARRREREALDVRSVAHWRRVALILARISGNL
jgi:hypothetical protein